MQAGDPLPTAHPALVPALVPARRQPSPASRVWPRPSTAVVPSGGAGADPSSSGPPPATGGRPPVLALSAVDAAEPSSTPSSVTRSSRSMHRLLPGRQAAHTATSVVRMTGSAPRSLADALRAWPDDRLARLLQARPDLATPVPPDLGVLAARAAVRLSVLRVLESVDAFTLAALEALLLLEEPPAYDDLAGLVGEAATGPQLRQAVDRLQDLALVWGTDAALHVVGAVREVLFAQALGLGRPAAALMSALTDRQLSAMRRWLDLPEQGGIGQQLGLFEDPVRLRALVDSASPQSREVLESLAAGPPAGQVRDALRPHTEADEANPVRWLIARGLLVPVDAGTVELPREVGLVVRGPRPLGRVVADPPLVTTKQVGTPTVDRSAAHAAGDVVQRTEALLEAWSTAPAPVLRAGGLGVRELKRVAKELDVTEPVAALVVELAHAAGLVEQSGSVDPEWVPTPAFDTWAGQPTERRWVVLAQAWLGLPRLVGLVGQRDDRDKVLAALGPDVQRPGAVADRRTVLAALTALPAGEAPDRDALVERLRWDAPRRGGRHRAGLVGWALDEAETLGLTGRGALSTAGRALLDGDDAAAARALSGLLPDPVDHVLVQPDLTVVAPGPLDRDLAREVALLADVESTGGATVYRVSEASVRRALDAGRSAHDITELLTTRSRTPVPQALTYLVEDVARRHGRLRVGAASSYLRCDDEALLAEVAADKRVVQLRLRRLAPTVLVSPASINEVLDGLRAAGYAPAAESPEGALLVARPDARRTAARPRPTRVTDPVLAEEQAALAVTALRAGDVASRAARRAPVTVSHATDTLAFLQQAAREGRQVWIGYVDAQGRSTSRVVEPRAVEGGFVVAYDHLRQEDRTFAVHRVTGVADVDADATE
jgi:hypothetical protein